MHNRNVCGVYRLHKPGDFLNDTLLFQGIPKFEGSILQLVRAVQLYEDRTKRTLTPEEVASEPPKLTEEDLTTAAAEVS